jgi:hypothetical protein
MMMTSSAFTATRITDIERQTETFKQKVRRDALRAVIQNLVHEVKEYRGHDVLESGLDSLVKQFGDQVDIDVTMEVRDSIRLTANYNFKGDSRIVIEAFKGFVGYHRIQESAQFLDEDVASLYPKLDYTLTGTLDEVIESLTAVRDRKLSDAEVMDILADVLERHFRFVEDGICARFEGDDDFDIPYADQVEAGFTMRDWTSTSNKFWAKHEEVRNSLLDMCRKLITLRAEIKRVGYEDTILEAEWFITRRKAREIHREYEARMGWAEMKLKSRVNL